MTVTHDDHGTKRQCGTCKCWNRYSLHPAPDKRGNPEPYLVGRCEARRDYEPHVRGSDTCGKWTAQTTPTIVDGSLLKQGEDGLWR